MKKKTYMKPSMQVYELQRHQLLNTSYDEGYIPNMREDMNQMA